MSKPLTTEAEIRRAFPKATHWWIKLQLAILRDGSVTFHGVRARSDLDREIQRKLGWPVEPGRSPHHQALKKTATDVLNEAIRPRRTGRARALRVRATTITAIVRQVCACRTVSDMLTRINEARVVHRRRPLTSRERQALADELNALTEMHTTRQIDWRTVVIAWLKKPNKHRSKSDAAR